MKIFQIALLISMATLGFFVPDLIQSFENQKPNIDIDRYCMLSTSVCKQNGVTMQLEHDSAKPLVPSQIEVIWISTSSDTIMLSMQGLEMDMGIAKYQLTRAENGHYIGEIMLPVCTQDTMTWIGTLTDGTKEVYPAIRMER